MVRESDFSVSKQESGSVAEAVGVSLRSKGVVATLELLGAVVLPTYVVIPLCGSDYRAYFTVGGILMLLSFVCAFHSPQAVIIKKGSRSNDLGYRLS